VRRPPCALRTSVALRRLRRGANPSNRRSMRTGRSLSGRRPKSFIDRGKPRTRPSPTWRKPASCARRRSHAATGHGRRASCSTLSMRWSASWRGLTTPLRRGGPGRGEEEREAPRNDLCSEARPFDVPANDVPFDRPHEAVARADRGEDPGPEAAPLAEEIRREERHPAGVELDLLAGAAVGDGYARRGAAASPATPTTWSSKASPTAGDSSRA